MQCIQAIPRSPTRYALRLARIRFILASCISYDIMYASIQSDVASLNVLGQCKKGVRNNSMGAERRCRPVVLRAIFAMFSIESWQLLSQAKRRTGI